MTSLQKIDKVLLPNTLADETQQFLRQVGRTGKEGMVLWVGLVEERTCRITNILIPRQRGIRSNNGVCVVVDSAEMLRINMELFHSGLLLIGQVHSHPTDAYHSEMDEEHAIANRIGSLSLVVPDFATGDFKLADCAVYRLLSDGTWDHMPTPLVTKLINLTAD
jgi:proteasome lid subunit RPN8/RPN11